MHRNSPTHMTFRLIPRFGLKPKMPTSVAALPNSVSPRTGDQHPSALEGLKAFYDANPTPSGKVLHYRGQRIAAVGVLPQKLDEPIDFSDRSPVSTLQFTRELLAEVNRIEVQAEEKASDGHIGAHKKQQILNATETVKVLMTRRSFEDSAQLRLAVNEVWRLQRAAVH